MSNISLEKIDVLSKIEYALLGLVEQLLIPSKPKRVYLKTSTDEADPQSEYSFRYREKMSHDICALSQIHKLLRNGQLSTKRDLYYDNKLLYGTQNKFDRSLGTVCRLLNCERNRLNVLSCSKGLVSGSLTLLHDNSSMIDCRKQQVLIAEALTSYRPISGARFILVVEKDATFQKLIDEKYFEIFEESILGKGFPDICTRKFLRWLVSHLSIPVYGLFDADPYGFEIFFTYKYGSSTDKAETREAFVKDVQWLGIKPSDVLSLQLAKKQHLSMAHRDFNKITRLQKRAKELKEEEIFNELSTLREQKHKFEIEAVSSLGQSFLTLRYLQPKLSYLL